MFQTTNQLLTRGYKRLTCSRAKSPNPHVFNTAEALVTAKEVGHFVGLGVEASGSCPADLFWETPL